MTSGFSEKEKWFVKLMTESAERERWGYELILKRADYSGFFDLLAGAGLFDPSRTSGPLPGSEPGYVQIPYWPALDYLEACAKQAGAANDAKLAEKVLSVVREVSLAKDAEGSARDNYHTHRKCAEVFGLLPLSCIREEDVQLVAVWLDSKFETGLVTRALDEGLLPRLLCSEEPKHWAMACLVLRFCTAIRWVEDPVARRNGKKPATASEDYWLRELIQHHSEALGTRGGREAVELLLDRVREVFDSESAGGLTWLLRPAVEEHAQNHRWDDVGNLLVAGARDVLLAWVAHDPGASHSFVREILRDDSEMVRRIALFVLKNRWDQLGQLFEALLAPTLFASTSHLHELYGLLKDRFGGMDPNVRAAVVQAIRDIPAPRKDNDPERSRRYIQHRWLSALVGHGDPAADALFEKLAAEEGLATAPTHPDFISYSEARWGPGPSQYSAEALAAFAMDGTLVERLNGFQETGAWRAPTTRALVDALEEAVLSKPEVFIRVLPSFLRAMRPFQYGIISGFKKAWDAKKDEGVPWERAWAALMDFFELVVSSPGFWSPASGADHNLTPSEAWVPALIADFLRAGSRDDTRAYPVALLPRAWGLIEALLAKSKAADTPDSDAMTQAVNTAKGRVVEALIDHGLRVCRLADAAHGGHREEWDEMKPTFDAELDKCGAGNYEFSTLVGAYIVQLHYLDEEWVRANLGRLFPAREENFLCAIAGLAFASVTRPVYGLLAGAGVLERALRTDLNGGRTRQQAVEMIALAYLWGDEQLAGGTFGGMFEASRLEDLRQVAWFFWTVKEEDLTDEQIQRVLAFWDRTVKWAEGRLDVEKLLGSLSMLAPFVTTVDERALRLLLAVAPFAHIDHRADLFVRELERLADDNSGPVVRVLAAFLEKYSPPFDFEGRMKSLLVKLAKHGEKLAALSLIQKVRELPGMRELYAEWVAGR